MLKNLCLVANPQILDLRDIGNIASRISELDKSILINILTPQDTADVIEDTRWQYRTLTVALCPTDRFTPRRGPILENRVVPKLEQYGRFLSGQITTPKTERFTFGKTYSPAEWSEFVVLKPLPLAMTSKSGQARLYRTVRIGQLTPATLPDGHFLRDGPALMQEFVDTGLHPSKFRVLSLLGEPLYSSVTRSAAPRAALDSSDEDIETSIADAKNPKSKLFDPEGQRNRLVIDHQVLAFARQVHAQFPRTPLLGIDILKRESDGRLFVIEVNAGGNVWHFSSKKVGHRQRLGGKEAMIAQLDAWNAAARIIIKATHEQAS